MGTFLSDNRFLYLLLAVLVITNIMGMTTGAMLNLVLTLPAVLIAITFHEFAHAYAATKLGDDTPINQGRLSLNPLSHIDPIGFALLLFAGFGWGKPVQINPRNFDRKYSELTGEAIVAIAGPLMNFFIAIIATIAYVALYKFAPTFIITQTGDIIWTLLQYLIIINIGLGIFNLIPLPPLDGSKVLVRFLPYNAKQWFYEKERIFYIVFLIAWITGLAGIVINPVLNFIYTGLLHIVLAIFGI